MHMEHNMAAKSTGFFTIYTGFYNIEQFIPQQGNKDFCISGRLIRTRVLSAKIRVR